MRWIRFVVLIICSALLHAGLIDVLAFSNLGIKPDLLIILLVFFAVYTNTTDAIITSFAIGFIADIVAFTPPMGPRMISFGIFGTLLAYLHRIIAVRQMSYQALAVFAVSLFAGILTDLLTFIVVRSTPPNIYTIIFWTSLYSAIVGPFLFLPIAWWMRIKTNRFSKS